MPCPRKILALGLLVVVMDMTMTLGFGKSEGASPPVEQSQTREDASPLDAVLAYISSGWGSLTRSMDDCKTFEDVKTEGEPIVYFPANTPLTPALTELQNRCPVRMEHLPWRISRIGERGWAEGEPDGLLYLEHPYVVPGGQFNEMYGWDSYFIILGLLRQNRFELAKGMVENFFFEIENYGGVLNANRTYYLTRSQPPFLSSMVLAIHEAETEHGQGDAEWLKRAYGFIVRDYEQWTSPPHLAGQTGLSRYFDQGDGPVPEIMGDPSHYYRGVAHFFFIHEGPKSPHLILVDKRNPAARVIGPVFPINACDSDPNHLQAQDCGETHRVALTAEFYKGDRSMRESGFDVSFRFGPFGAETHHYAPVCLNSLLYKTETDLEKIAEKLGRREEAQHWKERAAERRRLILRYLWDSSRGMYFDYDFTKGKRSSYEYATTFYPLWAGVATAEQARAVAEHVSVFEQLGGIAMGRRETQAQWDYPYGWAPIQLLAVEGLRRYGYREASDRIAYKFLSTVIENFVRDGTIREKYDVAKESDETHIAAGYAQNVVGFGWTNGVFLELLDHLPPDFSKRLRNVPDSRHVGIGPTTMLPDERGSSATGSGQERNR